MAGFDPLKVEAVARLPYALTLWTYWQRDDAAYMDELKREDERVDGAQLVTMGFIKGTAPIIARRQALQSIILGPLVVESVEEIERRADELWAQHERAIKKRPVS